MRESLDEICGTIDEMPVLAINGFCQIATHIL